MYIKCLVFAIFVAAVAARPDGGEDLRSRWKTNGEKCLPEDTKMKEMMKYMYNQESCSSNEKYSKWCLCALGLYDGVINSDGTLNENYVPKYKLINKDCYQNCARTINANGEIEPKQRPCELINCLRREKCIDKENKE